jgi:hypothetical protein
VLRNTIKRRKSQEATKPTASSQQPVARKRTFGLLATSYWRRASRSFQIFLWALAGTAIALGTLRATPAFADPHAVFYTDRGQEQVFFNVLAALNQADYVEPPRQPPIQSDQRLGSFIRTGTYIAPPTPTASPRIIRDADGNIQVVQLPQPLEPLENRVTGLEAGLPRIRVRQVTSDDGDVYFRERAERRARSEELRVILGMIACRAADQILGPQEANTRLNCPTITAGVSPDNLPFVNP